MATMTEQEVFSVVLASSPAGYGENDDFCPPSSFRNQKNMVGAGRKMEI